MHRERDKRDELVNLRGAREECVKSLARAFCVRKRWLLPKVTHKRLFLIEDSMSLFCKVSR